MESRFLYPEKAEVGSYGFPRLAEVHVSKIRAAEILNQLDRDLQV